MQEMMYFAGFDVLCRKCVTRSPIFIDVSRRVRRTNSNLHTTHMNITQHLLDLSLRPKLRLSEIERLIRSHRIIIPAPSRRALICLCEDGTLETAGKKRPNDPWLVYEDSFLKWLKSLDRRQ